MSKLYVDKVSTADSFQMFLAKVAGRKIVRETHEVRIVAYLYKEAMYIDEFSKTNEESPD